MYQQPNPLVQPSLVITGLFFLADVALSILYAMTPTSLELVREFVGIVEFGFMVLTMGSALRWLLESF